LNEWWTSNLDYNFNSSWSKGKYQVGGTVHMEIGKYLEGNVTVFSHMH